jgi:hypothetical protein
LKTTILVMHLATIFPAFALAQEPVAPPPGIDLTDPIWRGSESLRGNPHGLSPSDLYRRPVTCTTIDAPPAGPRGVFEDPSWPNGIIPIQFEPGLDASRQAIFLEALAEIALRTRIIFTQRSNEVDYIYVYAHPNQNFSTSIGRRGGRQDIAMTSWNYKYIMVHEIMHAIGIWHEQSAADRDNFVTINFQNISQTACSGSCNSQFAISPDANVSSFYDYDSVMHYARDAFSTNGQDTITTADPAWQDRIGQRERISNGDQETLSAMHGDPYLFSLWVLSSYAIPSFSNGTILRPDNNIISSLSRMSGATLFRMNIMDRHTETISAPLVIQKNVVINGAELTIR